MFYIRPIQLADLPQILRLSEKTGTGLTTLPADEGRLKDRITRSEKSFAHQAEKADECYVFVLVELKTQKVVGICAVEAAVGLREDWYNFRVGIQVHASQQCGVYNRFETLFLTNDHTGHSELCSLFLDADYRQGRNGALLSKSRLLFIGEFKERFASKIIAELRGQLDENNRSPFWEHLGKHFFSMDFSKADYLTGIGQKSFIAELMPYYPIYTVFLPPEARAVIGQVHQDTRAARQMLESEGFRYEGYVDIFDAGPTLECYQENIQAIRHSGVLPVTLTAAPNQASEDQLIWLVSNQRFEGYRACLVTAPRALQAMPLDALTAQCLEVQAGDTVRTVPLSAKDRLLRSALGC